MSEQPSRRREPAAAITPAPLRGLTVDVAPATDAVPFDLDAWADDLVGYLLEREGLSALPDSDEAA